MENARAAPRWLLLVGALGIAQVASWGSLFYAIGVLGAPMRAELGVSELFLFTAFTAGLLISGALSPTMGRAIDRRGGRIVMAAGSVGAALSLAILAAAPNATVMVIGWLMAGAAMALTLYDPAFATLSQHTGTDYRRAVTALTLYGGFASTVFWPLSQVLLDAWGWRATFASYAALQIVLCLPIHAFIVPKYAPRASSDGTAPRERSSAFGDSRRLFLGAAFAAVSFIVGVVAVHMVALLTAAGLTQAQAVIIGVLMGPMQVAGRIVEITLLRRTRSTIVGALSFAMIAASTAIAAIVDGRFAVAVVFVMLYGFGNGIFTVVRGSVPAEIWGKAGLGELLGALAGPSLVARALAPAAYSLLLTFGLTRDAALYSLTALTLAALAAYAHATSLRTKA